MTKQHQALFTELTAQQAAVIDRDVFLGKFSIFCGLHKLKMRNFN
jgi:hypothetical protein